MPAAAARATPRSSLWAAPRLAATQRAGRREGETAPPQPRAWPRPRAAILARRVRRPRATTSDVLSNPRVSRHTARRYYLTIKGDRTSFNAKPRRKREAPYCSAPRHHILDTVQQQPSQCRFAARSQLSVRTLPYAIPTPRAPTTARPTPGRERESNVFRNQGKS